MPTNEPNSYRSISPTSVPSQPDNADQNAQSLNSSILKNSTAMPLIVVFTLLFVLVITCLFIYLKRKKIIKPIHPEKAAVALDHYYDGAGNTTNVVIAVKNPQIRSRKGIKPETFSSKSPAN